MVLSLKMVDYFIQCWFKDVYLCFDTLGFFEGIGGKCYLFSIIVWILKLNYAIYVYKLNFKNTNKCLKQQDHLLSVSLLEMCQNLIK